MIKNLEHYIRLYSDWIPKTVCDETSIELKNLDPSYYDVHPFYDSSSDSLKVYDGEPSVTSFEVTHKKYIMDKIWDVLLAYHTDLELPWYNSWHGYNDVRFNKYETGIQMRFHWDHTQPLKNEIKGIPILTVIGCLNDDYTGGELVLCEDIVFKLRAGQIIIFPSVFLYPHKVNVVKSGSRFSFSTWTY